MRGVNLKALCLSVMSMIPFDLYASSSHDENENERAVRQILENPKLWASGRALYLLRTHKPADLSEEDAILATQYESLFRRAQVPVSSIVQDEKPRASICHAAVDKSKCALWCSPKVPTGSVFLGRDSFFFCLQALANSLFREKESVRVRTLHVSWTGDVTFGIQPR